jgi:hypothetical protein
MTYYFCKGGELRGHLRQRRSLRDLRHLAQVCGNTGTGVRIHRNTHLMGLDINGIQPLGQTSPNFYVNRNDFLGVVNLKIATSH